MKTALAAAALLLLGATADAGPQDGAAKAFQKRPLYVVVPAPVRFSAWSAGKTLGDAPVLFVCPFCGIATGMLTSELARQDGDKVSSEHALADPAIAIAESLARSFCPMLACSAVHVVSQQVPRSLNSARELADFVPADGYAMIVRTDAWGFNHLVSHWKRYRVFHVASVLLFDMASGRRVAHHQLFYEEPIEDRDDAPTRDELLAGDAALLKAKLKATELEAPRKYAETLRSRWVSGSRHVGELARRYTAAWCGQDPAAVAEFFDEDGSLTINGGQPAVGRQAIEAVARSFMQAFPDMVVEMDGLKRKRVREREHFIYRWTLTGTNTGPGGTGARLRISGQEQWSIGTNGRIIASLGSYDEAEYQRQLNANQPTGTP